MSDLKTTELQEIEAKRAKIREEEKEMFLDGLKKLQEKYGYSIDPVIQISGKDGVSAMINLVPTR
jgi:hypothetical protein